jgi:hypothetical protein
MLYDTKMNLLYKETDDKYSTDETVDQDDVVFLCDELYRHELLTVFGLEPKDIDKLTTKIEELYEVVKSCPKLNCDNATSLMFLFSYESFFTTHVIICDFLKNLK